ncbi:MAG: hypothetical protein R6U50_08865 [Desulfobacterales bacterium]
MQHTHIDYLLELTATADAAGYYACRMAKPLKTEEIIACLRCAPHDAFMHNILLHRLTGLSSEERTDLMKQALDDGDRLLSAACCESGFFENAPLFIKEGFAEIDPASLVPHTPLIVIKAKTADDHRLHAEWINVFLTTCLIMRVRRSTRERESKNLWLQS